MAARTPARRQSSPRAASAIPQLSWSEVRPAPVVLVSGAEGYLADRAVTALRDYLRSEDPSLEVSDLSADAYARGELATMASPSLFLEPRLIRVGGVEKASDDFLEEMTSYLASPADDTTVVLRHGGGQRGKRMLEAIRAAEGVAVEIVCAEITRDSDRYDFAAVEFRRAGRQIAPGALRALTSAFTGDLAELGAACAQLIADTTGRITEETVHRYHGGRAEVTAFAVADAALAGRHGEALVGLRQALDSGADPVPLIAAFATKIRTMARVHGASGAPAQVASALGVAPWQVERARRDLRGWDDVGLGRAIRAIAAADTEVKGGGRDPVYALERMVERISARGR